MCAFYCLFEMFTWLFWRHLKLNTVQMESCFSHLFSCFLQCPLRSLLTAHIGLKLAQPVSTWGPGVFALVLCLCCFAQVFWWPALCQHWAVALVALFDHPLLIYRLNFLHVTTYLNVLCVLISFFTVSTLPLDCKFSMNRNYAYFF